MSRALPVSTLRRSYQGKIEAARRPAGASRSDLVPLADTACGGSGNSRINWTRWRDETRAEFQGRVRAEATQLGIVADRVAFHLIDGGE